MHEKRNILWKDKYYTNSVTRNDWEETKKKKRALVRIYIIFIIDLKMYLKMI